MLRAVGVTLLVLWRELRELVRAQLLLGRLRRTGQDTRSCETAPKIVT